jgi:hypothetical protein
MCLLMQFSPFFAVPFYDVRNSLGVVKRQEKELNVFYDDDGELLALDDYSNELSLEEDIFGNTDFFLIWKQL